MDYNIYIHDKTNGQSKPTEPRQGGNTNTVPANAKKEAGDKAMAQNAANAGEAASASKAGAVVLAIYVAAKVTKEIVDTITPFVTRETGDYRFAVGYNNTKQTLSNAIKLINPITAVQFGMQVTAYYQEAMLFNQKQEQQRLLVGDSYINSISRKV